MMDGWMNFFKKKKVCQDCVILCLKDLKRIMITQNGCVQGLYYVQQLVLQMKLTTIWWISSQETAESIKGVTSFCRMAIILNIQRELLNPLCPSGMPPHVLKRKKKCPMMLLRNLDPARGHCNGTRYATGVHSKDSTVSIRQYLSPQNAKTTVSNPTILCNKSQGQTPSRIGIYRTKDFFSHGQLYVALSRVGHKKNLRILTTNGSYEGKEGKYKDIVV